MSAIINLWHKIQKRCKKLAGLAGCIVDLTVETTCYVTNDHVSARWEAYLLVTQPPEHWWRHGIERRHQREDEANQGGAQLELKIRDTLNSQYNQISL